MTVKEVSFRDFMRGAMPADILRLFDKRTRQSKGLFVSAEYADEVLAYIEAREKEKKEAKKRALLDFVGAFGEGEEGTHTQIKAQKYE